MIPLFISLPFIQIQLLLPACINIAFLLSGNPLSRCRIKNSPIDYIPISAGLVEHSQAGTGNEMTDNYKTDSVRFLDCFRRVNLVKYMYFMRHPNNSKTRAYLEGLLTFRIRNFYGPLLSRIRFSIFRIKVPSNDCSVEPVLY